MGAYDGRALSDLNISERGVRSEDDVVTNGAGSVDLGLRMDRDITPERDVGVDPGSGRVDHRDSGPHPALDDPTVELGPEPRQLHPVVDALGLPKVLDQVRADQQAFVLDDAQNVGEVLLALRIVRADLCQGLAQDCRVEGIEPGVDLADLELRVGGVLLLDDADNRAVRRAENAAIA